MRIAINTLGITPSCGGIRTWLVETARALARLGEDHRYLLIGSPLNRGILEPLVVAGRVERAELSLPCGWRSLRVWQEQFGVPRLLDEWGADAILSPNGVAPLRARCAQVVVLQHPWTPFLERISPVRRRYLRWMVPRSLRAAGRVVGVSRAVLDHFIEEGLVDPEKGEVIHHGVNRHALFAEPAPPATLDRIGSGYYLFVGDLYPYKGLERLLEAMSLLRRNLGLDRDLVVVGRDLWGQSARLAARVAELGLERSVHFLGGVDHGRLGWVYERAFCLVLPSQLEAFGMPLVEAMTCGTPVVASDLPAFREVVGDAALIVSPTRTGELVAALRRMEEPSVRASLLARGHVRAMCFDWAVAAARTVDACRAAAGLAAPAKTVPQHRADPARV